MSGRASGHSYVRVSPDHTVLTPHECFPQKHTAPQSSEAQMNYVWIESLCLLISTHSSLLFQEKQLYQTYELRAQTFHKLKVIQMFANSYWEGQVSNILTG